MEENLLFLWDKCFRDFPIDDQRIRLVSDRITKHAHEMTNALKVETPDVAAVALQVCFPHLNN
jgi:hypothetical protein